MARFEYRRTRTGLAPHIIEDTPPRVSLPIAWYAPKPAWMDHIPGPVLRFGSRSALQSYLNRQR